MTTFLSDYNMTHFDFDSWDRSLFFILQTFLVPKLGLSTQTLKPDSMNPDPRSRFNVISHTIHTARRLRALHCWIGSYPLSRKHCSTQLEYESRPCGGKVVFGSGSLIHIRSGSKVPCEEPHCHIHYGAYFYHPPDICPYPP